MLVCIVMALLNLGGTAVFNSLIGLFSGAIGATYALSIGCVLWRRLFGAPLPQARWSLGKLGVPINAIAFLYQIFTTVISFFPVAYGTDAKGMNWGIAMFGGAMLIAMVNYAIRGRKMYKGPVVHIVKDE